MCTRLTCARHERVLHRCKPSRVTLGQREHTEQEQGELAARRLSLMPEGGRQQQQLGHRDIAAPGAGALLDNADSAGEPATARGGEVESEDAEGVDPFAVGPDNAS